MHQTACVRAGARRRTGACSDCVCPHARNKYVCAGVCRPTDACACAQEYKPTYYCIAPGDAKKQTGIPVYEVRAYGRVAVPDVHLRAGANAAQVFPLAACVRERAAVVKAWRRKVENPLQHSCVLCHGAHGGMGHACSAWVRVQVHVPAPVGCDQHAETAACVHEQLAYAELSVLATTDALAPTKLSLLLCVAGEQQVLAGMLNAVALAACLRTPETAVPEFGVPPAGVSLFSLYACVEHYAAALELDAGARAALHLHTTRVALNQQPALEVSAAPGDVLACWRALLRHRLFHVPGEVPDATPSSHVVRAVRNATGNAIAAGDLVRMLEGAEHALPAWPEAFFAHFRGLFAPEFRVWSRDTRTAPRLHDAFASPAQRQRRELLFLQYVLRALGPPAVGTCRVPAVLLEGAGAGT